MDKMTKDPKTGYYFKRMNEVDDDYVEVYVVNRYRVHHDALEEYCRECEVPFIVPQYMGKRTTNDAMACSLVMDITNVPGAGEIEEWTGYNWTKC